MNTKFFNLVRMVLVLCALVLATGVASVHAQTLGYQFKVNIPFDFSVGNKKLPSGQYAVGRATHTDDAVVAVVDEHGRSKAIRTSMPVMTLNAKKKTTLVFHRYGDQYFLYQIWPVAGTTGRQFLTSSTEREIKRRLEADAAAAGKVGKNTQPETVTIDGGLQ
jgi:hypothetical protein